MEHDALEIWARTRQVIEAALERSGTRLADIAAIGITNQRETTVVWERKTGKPIYNAIVWQDTRTDAICNELPGKAGRIVFKQVTGLPLATYFSGPKIKWMLDNVPGARQRAENGELLFGNMDTWIIWNLTGVHITDVTNASRTLLMDLETLDWDEDILGLLGIPRVMLPRSAPPPRFTAKPGGSWMAFPLAATWATSRQLFSGRPVFPPAKPRIPMELAVSC